MKQHEETFGQSAVNTAKAIVRIFETGKPTGNFSALAILNDGAGISYGINQFTHRSGSLLAVTQKYLLNGGTVGRQIIEERLPLLAKTDTASIGKLSADAVFKKALQAAALTIEMRQAQESVGEQMYLLPAIKACQGSGFTLPLSLAVIYDSLVHGSYAMIRDRVKMPSGLTGEAAEKAWITEYVRERERWLGSIKRLRATRYRTRFFLEQIAVGRWHLQLPVTVHGVVLNKPIINISNAKADEFLQTSEPETPAKLTAMNIKNEEKTAIEPTSNPRIRTFADTTKINKSGQCVKCGTGLFDEIESKIGHAARQYDRIEQMAYSVTTRTDRAKSLWTTVAATTWQTGWAMFGFAAGLPREVWFVVAVIAGASMLFYLHRQITLGKIRETKNAEAPHRQKHEQPII